MEQPSSSSPSTMGPSTLDLLVLTFNCAKNLISVPVFATHLQQALGGGQNASTGELPELVVFSLQEVSPMGYAFIGGYFLNPYLSRFEEALNIAAVNIEASRSTSTQDGYDTPEADTPPKPVTPDTTTATAAERGGLAGSWSSRRRAQAPYRLVRSANVGMTAILLFARRPAAVQSVEVAECGFGVADMGNKGAAALRVSYAHGADPGQATELTFVATHLAPMEWNLKRRNANWRTIVSGLTFANPRLAVGTEHLPRGGGLPGRLTDSAASAARTPEEDAADEGAHERLLAGAEALVAEHHAALRDLSVFKPGAYLFVAGDLNYRIASKTPPVLATFPVLEEGHADHWSGFLERDQLTQERLAGRTMHGLSEAAIAFPPTYKYDIVGTDEGAEGEVVEWKWAPHRWPSWTDRVLFLAVPGWAKRRLASSGDGDVDVRVRAYRSLPLMRSSDHQPVFLRAAVPLLSPAELAPPSDEDGGEEALQGDEADDPRVRLPVPVDVDAWERRAAARRREVLAGWSMLLWSTREGAVLIGTVMLVGVTGWWLWQSML